MRKVYNKYPGDPDIVYFFAEAILVLNAWQLYDYPSGTPLSPDVEEVRDVLERGKLLLGIAGVRFELISLTLQSYSFFQPCKYTQTTPA